MVQAFDEDFFQGKLDSYLKFEKLHQDDEGKDRYLKNLLDTYGVKFILFY